VLDADRGAGFGYELVQVLPGERGGVVHRSDDVADLAFVEVVQDANAERAETDVEDSEHGGRA
jgi:hypothetical protein